MTDLSPWKRVKQKVEAGESVPIAVRKMAEEVLGERFFRPSRSAMRPDFRDREAGDDSFNDDADGGMALL